MLLATIFHFLSKKTQKAIIFYSIPDVVLSNLFHAVLCLSLHTYFSVFSDNIQQLTLVLGTLPLVTSQVGDSGENRPDTNDKTGKIVDTHAKVLQVHIAPKA